jgi:hypothetical protein
MSLHCGFARHNLSMAGGKKSKFKLGCLMVSVLALGFIAWFYGPLVLALWHIGIFDKKSAAHAYDGTSIDNLKYMRTALLGYEESEGLFPEAGGWVDAIQNRLNTDDLKKGEAAKKLVYPEFVGQAGKFGYAFNGALSKKYHGDVKDGKTPLIFESTSTDRNAHGDPAKIRKPGGLAISVDGTILK